ncbi:MAG: HAD family hydrolase [Gemmatimonadetes bacterium]|nr:HAD family hydrolase [Gemmatimonadota bacterium]
MPHSWSVFLDRDGVLNRKAPEGDYIKTWAEFSWLPGSLEALRQLHQAGLRILIVTNQQGVARGLIRPRDLDDIHQRLQAEVSQAGGHIDRIYVCPHLAGTCECRKPGTGLFLAAAQEFPDLAFERSVVVGDSPTDLEPGRRLESRTVLIGPARSVPGMQADAVALTLLDAVDRFILPWTTRDG